MSGPNAVVHMTNAQERRRRIAFRLDNVNLPDWVNRSLCVVIARGHTPIWYYGAPHCAFCQAPAPPNAPDTVPQGWKR